MLLVVIVFLITLADQSKPFTQSDNVRFTEQSVSFKESIAARLSDFPWAKGRLKINLREAPILLRFARSMAARDQV